MFDAGQFTCQGIDRGVQQCKSHYVQVKNKPDVKVTPMSTTVEKVKISLDSIIKKIFSKRRLPIEFSIKSIGLFS